MAGQPHGSDPAEDLACEEECEAKLEEFVRA